MHFPVISKVLGMLLMIFSLTLLPPLLVASIYGETTHHAFFLSFAITFSIGMLIWLPYSHSNAELRARDGFFITVMFWLELGIVGALPFILIDAVHLSFTDAVFESISGLSTTGATVMTGLDSLPKSILYYRQQLQWLGGIGIVVIAVAVMPMLGVGGMQLYRTEIPGPVKDTKLTPRIAETAKILFIIYLILTVTCAAAFWLAGMTLFDAISHSFSTVAIGGFSTHDASMGFFQDNPAIISICMFFMIISGISFGLHYYTWVRKSVSHYLRNPEARLYLILLLLGTTIVCLYLFYSNTYNESDSLYYGAFQLVSIMTTTGFSTTNFSVWPSFVPFLLMFACFSGACSNSTGGGIKVGRILILAKQSIREIHRLIHPSAIFPIKIRNKQVPVRVTDAVWAFFGIYLAVFSFMVLLLMASGLDYVTAWSAVAATINNLGPGLGGVAAHYGGLNPFAKWVLSCSMLLGRLEIFPLLVLFSPMFWRR